MKSTDQLFSLQAQVRWYRVYLRISVFLIIVLALIAGLGFELRRIEKQDLEWQLQQCTTKEE